MPQSNRELLSPTFVVVIGTSAGGLNALVELISRIDKSIDAAIFIVMHLSPMVIGDFLPQRLQQSTSLPCIFASNGMPIERGHIYIAPANLHLLIKESDIIVGHGPEENRWRPSIDVLFRSAATAYDGRTIGVVLTGLLDDGAAGMLAIKRCGGKTIVQDPHEAEYPDMPHAVMNMMEVDACVVISEIANVIKHFTLEKNPAKVPVPEDVKAEAELSERITITIDAEKRVEDSINFSDPDGGGGLWKITNGGLEHHRHRVEHAYPHGNPILKQSESVEGSLWVAVRIMEERRRLLMKMEEDTRSKGFKRLALEHKSKREELDGHIERLKKLLFALQRTERKDMETG